MNAYYCDTTSESQEESFSIITSPELFIEAHTLVPNSSVFNGKGCENKIKPRVTKSLFEQKD